MQNWLPKAKLFAIFFYGLCKGQWTIKYQKIKTENKQTSRHNLELSIGESRKRGFSAQNIQNTATDPTDTPQVTNHKPHNATNPTDTPQVTNHKPHNAKNQISYKPQFTHCDKPNKLQTTY